MNERATFTCNECGQRVELASDAFAFTCTACGFDQPTYALWTALAIRVRGDRVLEALVSDWSDLLRREPDEQRARRIASALTTLIDEVRTRLELARATFLTTERPSLPAVREAAGADAGPGAAWRALVAAGWVSVDPTRRFMTAKTRDDVPSLEPFLYENDVAIAFAASIDAVRKAEQCFEAFCGCIGRTQTPVWDGIFGAAHCLGSVPGVELEDAYALRESLHDAERSVIASVLTAIPPNTDVATEALASGAVLTRAPNAFDHLAALYATGTTIELVGDEEEAPIVLRLAPPPDAY